jgi:hypothetical protein
MGSQSGLLGYTVAAPGVASGASRLPCAEDGDLAPELGQHTLLKRLEQQLACVERLTSDSHIYFLSTNLHIS